VGHRWPTDEGLCSITSVGLAESAFQFAIMCLTTRPRTESVFGASPQAKVLAAVVTRRESWCGGNRRLRRNKFGQVAVAFC
jgi:hypothetical protein